MNIRFHFALLNEQLKQAGVTRTMQTPVSASKHPYHCYQVYRLVYVHSGIKVHLKGRPHFHSTYGQTNNLFELSIRQDDSMFTVHSYPCSHSQLILASHTSHLLMARGWCKTYIHVLATNFHRSTNVKITIDLRMLDFVCSYS